MDLNQLGYYQICPVLTTYKEIYFNDDFRWLTFDIDIGIVKDDIIKFLNVLIYKMLLQILVSIKEETVIERSGRSLKNFENQFNMLIWKIFPSTEYNIKLVANAWVRLIGIYNKFIEIAKNYPYLAENIELTKRIFRINPVSIELVIPIIFINKNTSSVECVTIVPEKHSHKTTRMMSIFNYFILDYMRGNSLNLTGIHEISYEQDVISKNFLYHYYMIPQMLYGEASRFFSSLQNNREPNKDFCPSCSFNNQCDIKKISNRILVTNG